ncbi:uncharacterized protein [Apostichopus japonicus]|uniref:uncharacterized protein n=1 Tax=Stichopus japonicus TaxID=307972 RepID=UPI003AB727D9
MESPVEEPERSFEPDILHPELLSKEKILKLLRDRQVKVDNEDGAEMSFLVDLFRRTLMPLPQRVPRNNRRGTRTKALIKRLDAQKPRLEEKAVEYQNPKRTAPPKKGLLISSDLNLTPGSRLKPPPIVINKKRTLLKLGLSPNGNKAGDNKITNTRTGLTKVQLASSSSQGLKDDKTKTDIQNSQDSAKPGRTKITFSDSSPAAKKRVSPETQKGGLLISLKNAKVISSPKKSGSVTPESNKPNRSYITLNEDTNSKPKSSESGSSKRSISTVGMDAVRKALGTSTEGKRKKIEKKEKPALKRSAVGSAIENPNVSDKKKRKITWP